MKATTKNDLAERIRERFRASGWSILQLAKRANAPYAAVHGFVNGDRDVLLLTASKLCRALELQLRPVRGKRKGR